MTPAEADMGLSVSVGAMAWCLKEGYAEDADHYRRAVQNINHVLAAHGLPPHVEPEVLPQLVGRDRLGGFPYSWRHYLRRAVAFARQAPQEFCPVPNGVDPAHDTRIDRELSVFMNSHFICHSDCEGYYVPIDFPEPLYNFEGRLAGDILGSSQQALRELVQVAPLLGVTLRTGTLSDAEAGVIADEPDGSHPYWIEREVWLCLFDRFTHSVRHGTMVSFG